MISKRDVEEAVRQLAELPEFRQILKVLQQAELSEEDIDRLYKESLAMLGEEEDEKKGGP